MLSNFGARNAELRQMDITKDMLIEELIDQYPFSVEYLREKGIRCIRCGEPIWGTLEQAAKEKKFSDKDIQNFVDEMNQLRIEKT